MAGTAGGTTAERRAVMTRNSSSEREPPFGADTGFPPISALVIQIWAFCTQRQSRAGYR
jgi:hypothetical protein